MNLSQLWLIPLLPFAGFLINGTIGRKLPRRAVAAIALLATVYPPVLVMKLWMFMQSPGAAASYTIGSRPWIAITGLQVNFTLAVDHLTLIMLGVVTGVGFLIHVYSASYMAEDEGYWGFFAYLNLFMFFMLILVLAESFLLLFVGWEGVGLASYLLIGFYFKKDSAANAGKKAFIVNRIGDFGFLLAMFLLITHFGSLSFANVFGQISAMPAGAVAWITPIALLLVLGAAGKSAQIPLYVWLPDAMEGPTPVSALIHAATMVTAGIYMVARCHVLFDRSPTALTVVAIIGAATALMAATIGMVQHDIKRVLAYSTVSQLGYMFMACGVGAYEAGIFHLMTHAFFKALLFLAAGSVIHALSGEQDMRLMGGLRKKIPVTFWTMSAGVFAIAGLPPLAAFFSKDEILYQTYIWENPLGKLLWAAGMLTAFLTAFYMFRLWYKTFFGPYRFEDAAAHGYGVVYSGHAPTHDSLEDHGAPVHSSSTSTLVMDAEHDSEHSAHPHGVHESSWGMLVPLILLAILSVVGGWVGVPLAFGGHNEFEHFLEPVFAVVPTAGHIVSRNAEPILAVLSVLTALLGWATAHVLYFRKRGRANELARSARPVYSLLSHKYWVDEIYGALIISPLLFISRIILGGLVDAGIVQGASSAAGGTTRGLSSIARRMQSGNIRSYAGWLALGAATVILITLFGIYSFHAGIKLNIDHNILTILLLTPLVGAGVLALIPEREESKTHHWAALIVTLLTLLFTLHLPFRYAYADHTANSFQFEQNLAWIAGPAIRYHLGVDGLSMWLVVLTGLLAPLGVLASWNAIKVRTKTFFVLFLLQQVAMIGIFVSLDLFLYYGFWELSLVPMTLLIATFGRTENRRKAGIKYFLYAFIPSAILLVGMIWLYARTGTFDMPALHAMATQHLISPNSHALWLCSLAFLVAFAVKVPVFPLHGWLSDAISEAPTALVMVLAGKLGLYSILRFSFGIFPEQSRHIAPLLIALGAIGIVYGALNALVQNDLKKLAAFSTLSHVSFITLGIFTFTIAGIDGGTFQILNESLIGAALFILLGLLYERYGTYDMRDYGGLAVRHPWMVTMFVVTSLAAVGLPMMNGFVGEFLILTGTMQSVVTHHVLWTVVGTTGVIFSASYMLWMIQRVFYGALGYRPEEVHGWDLSVREHIELWPIAILFLVMGLASPLWMKSIDTYGAMTADKPQTFEPGHFKHIETETYGVVAAPEVGR